MGTIHSITMFISGALMWGRFPGAEEPFVDQMDKDNPPIVMREMRITNKFRGAVFMAPIVLYFLGCIGVN